MKKIKNSRKLSFFVVTVIYIAAFFVALPVFEHTPGGILLKVFTADVAATVFTFLFSLIFKNASVYDPYWSVQPIVILWALLPVLSAGTGAIPLLLAITFWGIRLTANWAYTFHGLCHEDWRYTMLHDTTGRFYPLINFIGIHMVPTLVVYLVTVPAILVMESCAEATLGGWIFSILAIGSATMQGIADIYMQKYRKKGIHGFIRDGIWKYARHPNYLGEITMWWNIAIASLFMGAPWWVIAGAAANTLLFFTVSIPMADKRQAKKPGYALYKASTRSLLPLPKKQPESIPEEVSV